MTVKGRGGNRRQRIYNRCGEEGRGGWRCARPCNWRSEEGRRPPGIFTQRSHCSGCGEEGRGMKMAWDRMVKGPGRMETTAGAL